MLEAARDNGGFSNNQSSQPLISTGAYPAKGKSKGIFTTFDAIDVESDEEQAAGVHTAAVHSDWIKPGSGYIFPCPMINHDHKIASCAKFIALTPKDLWFKISKGRICYTCLKPNGFKGVCTSRRCSEEKGVPQVLLCAACWAPFSSCVKNQSMDRID